MTDSTTIRRTADATPADFSHVHTWIFDLDNTLYPRRTDLFSQIDQRMTSFVAELLQVPPEEAKEVQKRYYREYGTTLRGLMTLHDIEPDTFLRYVHNIDYSWLSPDPELGAEIAALPGRKLIFTNGDRAHAERAARQLGIFEHFEDVFDIVAAGLVPLRDDDVDAVLDVAQRVLGAAGQRGHRNTGGMCLFDHVDRR